jgi:hypothetical protein
MKALQRGRTKIVSGAVLAFALISVTAAAEAGNAASDCEQLIANEKAWAQAAQDSDADRMASYMAEEYVEHVWEGATASVPAHWSSTRKKEWVEAVRRRTEVYSSVEVRNLTVHLARHPCSGHRGILADRYKEWERHLVDRDIRGHVAEAEWPLGSDRQRISVSDP